MTINETIKLLKNADLIKKKKTIKILFENEKNIRFSNIEIQNQKINQYKESVSIKNIDINKRVLSNKVSFGKEDLYILLVIKMPRKVTFKCISTKN